MSESLVGHVCPFCNAWTLTAPVGWDPEDIATEMQTHVQECLRLAGLEVTIKEPNPFIR